MRLSILIFGFIKWNKVLILKDLSMTFDELSLFVPSNQTEESAIEILTWQSCLLQVIGSLLSYPNLFGQFAFPRFHCILSNIKLKETNTSRGLIDAKEKGRSTMWG